MVIQCPSCQSKYKYPENRFEGQPVKKVKCTKCGGTFEIQNSSVKGGKEDTTGNVVSQTKRISARRGSDLSPEDAALREIPLLPDDRKLSISILDGPMSGTIFQIEKPTISIGRTADLSLNDPEASRLHAMIEIHGRKYILKDCGSTNGTFVGGKRVTAEVTIENLTEFRVGSTPMMFIETKEEE